MIELNVKLTFTEELLGTASADPSVHEEYIAANKPDGVDPAEVSAIAGADGEDDVAEPERETPVTVFARDDEGNPILWDYQIKGFFKDACGMLRRVPGTNSAKLKAYKKIIDGLIFVTPRTIAIHVQGDLGRCDRPLRAQTAKGERIALAASETAPAGSWIEFAVQCMNNHLGAAVEEWLDYGQLRGLGQWRNSGKGRFTVEVS